MVYYITFEILVIYGDEAFQKERILKLSKSEMEPKVNRLDFHRSLMTDAVFK